MPACGRQACLNQPKRFSVKTSKQRQQAFPLIMSLLA